MGGSLANGALNVHVRAAVVALVRWQRTRVAYERSELYFNSVNYWRCSLSC
jgi:hypothetical protein